MSNLIQLFANNAKTTLASGITSTQTSITVAPGTGSQFPSPVSGVSAFTLTLVSASSSSTYEICLCTARSGDTLTVVRGQEGTTGQTFLLNDIVGQYDTAGVMAALVQSQQLQNQYYLFAAASGTANALTATIPSLLTSIPDGMSIVVKSSYANTGAATLNLILGSTSTGALPIVTGNNTALASGTIPGAGYPITLSYSSTFNAWVITDGNIDLSTYAPINSPTFTGTPAAPTPTINDNSTKLATTAYVQNNLANYAPIYNPTLTGTPAAPTASAGTNTTQIATTAYALQAGIGWGQTWQNLTGSRSVGTTYTNSTGKPIFIAVSIFLEGILQSVAQLYVSGVLVGQTVSSTAGYSGVGSGSPMTAIVPNGATYQAIAANGYTLIQWAELR
jgi:hypothetical protein